VGEREFNTLVAGHHESNKTMSSSPLLASAFYTLPYMGLKWKQNWSPLPTSESNQAQWMLGHFSILPVCDRDGNGLDSSRVE
jgi:hypothetical protein